jgi:hypothetical protein
VPGAIATWSMIAGLWGNPGLGRRERLIVRIAIVVVVVVVAVVAMIVITPVPVLGWPTAVITARKKGRDCNDYHAGARPDRTQVPCWLSAGFHDVAKVETLERHHKVTRNDCGALALCGCPEGAFGRGCQAAHLKGFGSRSFE